MEDTAGDPDTALTKVELLVEQQEVDLVIGVLLANVGLAVAEYIKTTDVPYLIPMVAADDLTQRETHPQVIRVAGGTASQTNHPLGAWAADQGHETVVTLGADYNFGHQTTAGFVNTFTDNGGDVVEVLWDPLGTQDFGPYLAGILDLEPDAVYAVQIGGDALRFVQQWEEFGLADSGIELIAAEQTLDQSLLPAMGDAANGLMGATRFAAGRDSPATRDFVAAYEDVFEQIPNVTAALMYTAGMWTKQAIESLDGDLSDLDSFIEAIRRVELEDSPNGPMRMDEFGNPIYNTYITRVEPRDDGQLWHVPVEVFEEVSQFWNYDVDEFLEHPPYSREYQGDGVWPEPNPIGS